MRVLVTGAGGFIAGYLIPELLEAGHRVTGVDNHSKYGPAERSFDDHPRYRFAFGDVKDGIKGITEGHDVVIAAAAMIGGIAYFHELAYDLLAENERITAATFDAAIHAKVSQIVVVSSSMVYENTLRFPTREIEAELAPPPSSTYGFQKLATEYFAKGAWEQYKLPYTIVRPFNAVGIGERHALASANPRIALSHVVPDLIRKALDAGPTGTIRILGSGMQRRHYTYAGDLARGIRLTLERPEAINKAFNLSTATGHTVLEVLDLILGKLYPQGFDVEIVHDEPFKYDVPRRVPSTSRAARLLGFEAKTPLEVALDEVIEWIKAQG